MIMIQEIRKLSKQKKQEETVVSSRSMSTNNKCTTDKCDRIVQKCIKAQEIITHSVKNIYILLGERLATLWTQSWPTFEAFIDALSTESMTAFGENNITRSFGTEGAVEKLLRGSRIGEERWERERERERGDRVIGEEWERIKANLILCIHFFQLL